MQRTEEYSTKRVKDLETFESLRIWRVIHERLYLIKILKVEKRGHRPEASFEELRAKNFPKSMKDTNP